MENIWEVVPIYCQLKERGDEQITHKNCFEINPVFSNKLIRQQLSFNISKVILKCKCFPFLVKVEMAFLFYILR